MSLTNQTMYIFKSHGSTERVTSSNKSKHVMTEQKFKKDFIKRQGNSDRAYVNRSALNSKPDPNAIILGGTGKSPDRTKNMSVYSQGPYLGPNTGAQGGSQPPQQASSSTNVIGPSRSPYLGTLGNSVGPGGMKKRMDSNQSSKGTVKMLESDPSKKESMLAAANSKHHHQFSQSTGSTQKGGSSSNPHLRTKSHTSKFAPGSFSSSFRILLSHPRFLCSLSRRFKRPSEPKNAIDAIVRSKNPRKQPTGAVPLIAQPERGAQLEPCVLHLAGHLRGVSPVDPGGHAAA